MRRKGLRNSNFKILLTIISLIFSINSESSIFSERMKNPDTVFLQKSLINLISPQKLKNELNQFLQVTFPGRSYKSLGHKGLKKFFSDYAVKNNVWIEQHKFVPEVDWALNNLKNEFSKKIAKQYSPNSKEYKKWANFVRHIEREYKEIRTRKFSNYFWKKDGRDKSRTLILSANIDSIGQISSSKEIVHDGYFFGAHDNASSVVSLLELIKVFNQVDLPYNVMIVFFDLQEFGNLGSNAFAKDYFSKEKNTIITHINSLRISKVNGTKTPRVFKLFGQRRKTGEGFLRKAGFLIPEAKLKREFNNYAGSDTGPFIDREIDSYTLVGLNQAEEKNLIHQVSDSVETIDFYQYSLGTKLLFSLALSWMFP